MIPFQVRHERTGAFYRVLAASPVEAVEIVTLRLGDADGAAGWRATVDPGAEAPPKGVVLDAAGQPVRAVEG